MQRKITEITSPEDLENFEFELSQQTVDKENPKHYVNNRELFDEFVIYHKKKMKAYNAFVERKLEEDGFSSIEAGGEGYERRLKKEFTPPPLTDTIGLAIMSISKRRCYSPRFVNYTSNWKEEMIADAIETCVAYAHNFDPEKSENPFAYLTQFVNNAIFLRLKKEHKQQYVRYKMFDELHGFAGDVDDTFVNPEDVEMMDETNDMYQNRLEYIEKYEQVSGINKDRKKRVPTNMKNLGNLMDDIEGVEGE